MKVYYSPDYVAATHGFDTTRKARWIADSLAAHPINGVEMATPAPLTVEDLLRVHDAHYVDAVRTGSPRLLAESQGFDWDAALWPMVLASNGGVLAAARSALTDGIAGSLSSGLHHAKRDSGDGFCTFNGLAVAAKALLAEGAVASVLILDLDAHCGGGTAQLVDGDTRIWHEDVSVSGFDSYTGNSNSVLRDVEEPSGYLSMVEQALEEADRIGPFDLCLYNAGMDPYQGCAIGGLAGITGEILAKREEMVFDWCRSRRTPAAFVLAGGYVGSELDESTLVNLHRLTISEAASSSTRARFGDDV